MKKVYKKGVRYYSEKKGILGLTLCGTRNSGWKNDYYVRERMINEPLTAKNLFTRSKVVFEGTLSECRAYMARRFGHKK